MWIQPSEVADLTTKTRGLNPENRRFNQQNKRKIRPQDASTNNMPEQKKQRQPMGIPLGWLHWIQDFKLVAVANLELEDVPLSGLIFRGYPTKVSKSNMNQFWDDSPGCKRSFL